MSPMRGIRVLVTGAGGFIGGHLVAELLRGGADVRAMVRYNSRNDRGSLEWFDEDVIEHAEVVAGDLRDVESVAHAVDGVDVVFHLGAQIAIPYSYANPRDFFEVNALGSLNVAQACVDAQVQRLVHASSSEVYGTARTIPITEDHPLEPRSPYAASKVAADKIMDSYHRSFGLPATIVRPFNTYGPHQSARAVIPTIIGQAIAGGVVRLGSLHPRRDLTFVTDTVAGLVAAASAPEALGATVQLGSGQDHSVGDVVAMVGDIVGRELEVELDPSRVRPENSEVQRLVAGAQYARELIGWEPVVDLRDGLAATVEWMERNGRRYRAHQYVI